MPNNNPPEESLSTIEAAEMLGVSPRTIRNMIERGDLKAVKLNPKSKSVYLVTVESVHTLLEEREK